MAESLDPQLQELIRRLDAGERLQFVAVRIGLALWYLQDLEVLSAQCFAMVAKPAKGTSVATAQALLREARGKPFGSIIDMMAKAGMLSPALETRFDALREERNWLVHRSHEDSRSAVHANQAMWRLVVRLESMTNEGLALLKELEKIAMEYAIEKGVSAARVMEIAKKTLEGWRSGHAD